VGKVIFDLDLCDTVVVQIWILRYVAIFLLTVFVGTMIYFTVMFVKHKDRFK